MQVRGRHRIKENNHMIIHIYRVQCKENAYNSHKWHVQQIFQTNQNYGLIKQQQQQIQPNKYCQTTRINIATCGL